jgi:hypothetical protein
MPKKKYIVKLSLAERGELESLIRRGRCAGWKIQRAQALLAMDASEWGPCWIDARIAEAYRCTSRCVEMWRKQAVEQGPMSLMERVPFPERARKLGGEVEARVVALCCSEPPSGRERWSLRLVADRLVELEIVDGVSHETVRRTLKKTILSRGAS